MKNHVKVMLLTVLFAGTVLFSNAQELRCNISINTSKIQGTNKSIFTTLQSSLYEFMNNTKWTGNIYSEEERIECSIFITINEQIGSSRFGGTLQIQAKRPVYATSYQTVTFNFMDDDFIFDYIEFDKLEFEINTFRSNLTSVMAFYAYVILGIDYDTFSLKGGSEFLSIAQQIVVNTQGDNYAGWKPYEKASRRNRYWIVDNMLDNNYSLVRGAYYKYHRLGMDKMSDQVTEGREQIMQALLDIQKVYREKPDPYLFYLKLFFDAKADEIANIFQEATQPEKTRVVQILQEIDNSNSRKYAKITETTN
ncbi:MAG: DUF4835 family protein [Prevotellaceae bacterium]|jgi:hypothetical protein|nr:DUF4835 family protein [Prevotellaceae bacterium]